MRVNALQELKRISTANVNLAERRGIHDAQRVTSRETLPGDRRVQVLTTLREVPGTMPLADHFERRTGRLMRLMNGSGSYRLKQISDILTGKRAKGYGGVGRTKCRRANFGDRFAKALSENRHAIDVAELTLISAKAQGRIALDVFDIAVAFANRETHIGNAGVVLIIDELFGTAIRALLRRHTPERLDRHRRTIIRRRCCEAGRFEAAARDGLIASRKAFAKASGQ